MEEEAEESEEQMLKRKPWGDTLRFCPVALAEKGVLWPGTQDIAARLVIDCHLKLKHCACSGALLHVTARNALLAVVIQHGCRMYSSKPT